MITSTALPSLATDFSKIEEIAADLERPISTIRDWAAGSRSDFPPVVRLPNRALLVGNDDLCAWYGLIASSPSIRDKDRASARGAVRRLNHGHSSSRVRFVTPTPNPNDPSWLTLAEFASTVRQSYSTVSQWCRRGGGDFPAHVRLPNNKVLVHVDDRDKWLRERRS